MEILLKCPKSKNNELLLKYQKATFLCFYGILYGYSRSYLLCTMDILGTRLFHTIMEPFSKHILYRHYTETSIKLWLLWLSSFCHWEAKNNHRQLCLAKLWHPWNYFGELKSVFPVHRIQELPGSSILGRRQKESTFSPLLRGKN